MQEKEAFSNYTSDAKLILLAACQQNELSIEIQNRLGESGGIFTAELVKEVAKRREDSPGLESTTYE